MFANFFFFAFLIFGSGGSGVVIIVLTSDHLISTFHQRIWWEKCHHSCVFEREHFWNLWRLFHQHHCNFIFSLSISIASNDRTTTTQLEFRWSDHPSCFQPIFRACEFKHDFPNVDHLRGAHLLCICSTNIWMCQQ
jgi:hypothetical protein